MLDILTIDKDTEGALRKKAARVSDVKTSEMRRLVTDMISLMRVSDGVGLAAPQVGRPLRLFVIEVDGRVSVFFNPVFTMLSDETMTSEEGCLSVPDRYYVIDRSKRATMEYIDQNGERKRIDAEGFLAAVLQHEFDHLEGILFTDRVNENDVDRQSSDKNYAL
ncbi:MAG TPA: peptide deformylase [Candidatus Fimivivens sp.]|nr:peptide deformylase [Candidatus Fimivivens sp.]